MHKYIKILVVTIISFIISFGALYCQASSQEHIKKFDAVRSAMTKLGDTLPDMIKKAEPIDIRTLERTFEINNYAMMTMECYLKMVKISLASGNGINPEQMKILIGWLKFIYNYTEYDIKYFDEALAITKNKDIIAILNSAKTNISDLRDSSKIGIDENGDILEKLAL